MKCLFYLGHPAHFHLCKNVVDRLEEEGNQVEVLIRKKDVLEDLLQRAGWSYRNILQRDRGDTKLQMAWSLLVRDWAVLRIAREVRPDLMVGTSAAVAHVGKLLGIPTVFLNEDDHDVVPLLAKAAYPFTDTILAPNVCRVGRWGGKTVSYDGYHELAYLHPSHFAADERITEELGTSGDPYFILRFARLNAHHDGGRNGLDTDVAEKLIRILEPYGNVFITAERQLEPQFEKYRIRVDPNRIHDALSHAHMYIGDSQTMAAEAAVLGTPSLRFNDFVGEIGYLEELEHCYGLTYGIETAHPERLFAKVDELLQRPNLEKEWARKRQRMLEEKIDLTAFLVWFIENYPDSVREARENPEVQDQFQLEESGEQ